MYCFKTIRANHWILTAEIAQSHDRSRFLIAVSSFRSKERRNGLTDFLLFFLLFSGKFFTVKLPAPLPPGGKIRLSIETVFTHVLQPYPTHISQAEKQFVVFEGNHYFYSPYVTKTQTTRVKLASRNIENYTKLGNPSRSEDMIEYGPFKDVPPYSEVNFYLWQRMNWINFFLKNGSLVFNDLAGHYSIK